MVRKKLHDNHSAAEDVVHQAFEALIRNPYGYDHRKDTFIAGLQGIAHFKVMDYLAVEKARDQGCDGLRGTDGG